MSYSRYSKQFGPKLTKQIEANVGIIGHEEFAEKLYENQLKKRFTKVKKFRDYMNYIRNVSAPTLSEIEVFIDFYKIDYVILEANLGEVGGKLAFNEDFFNKYRKKRVFFYLYSGENLQDQINRLTCRNILGYSLKTDLGEDGIRNIAAKFVLIPDVALEASSDTLRPRRPNINEKEELRNGKSSEEIEEEEHPEKASRGGK